MKPFERTELGIKVNTALDMRSLRIENRDYQENLERLVSARTAELKVSNLALSKEINHRKQLESSLRKTTLVGQGSTGSVIRSGRTILACMCGAVIQKRTDPQHFLTLLGRKNRALERSARLLMYSGR